MAKKAEKNTEKLTLPEKLAKIRQQIGKVNASAGKIVAGFLNDKEIADSLTVKYLPTPNDDLNEAIGGGFPIGRTAVITGLSDSGKTSIALETLGQAMARDPEFVALWLESENSLELDYLVDTFHIDPGRFIVVEMNLKEGGEAALDQCASILRTGTVNAFVINSMKALIPKTQLNKAISEDTVALQARMNTKALSQYLSIIHEHGIAFIIIQHLSTLIGTMARDPYALAGGLFMKYSGSLILDFRKQSVLDTDPITKEEGQKYMISVKKNHVCPKIYPYVKVPHYIIYGEGTEVVLTTLRKAIDQGVLRATGAWIYWDEKQLKWNGKAAFREDMKNNPDTLQTLRNLVYGDIERLTKEEMKQLEISEEDLAADKEANPSIDLEEADTAE